MTATLAGAVELLDRSLSYTRAALALVTPDRLGDPTPCARWDLGDLLAHMDDGLDAFTEAATGEVSLVPLEDAAGLPRLESIRAKACALLGWWCAHPPESVRLGSARLSSRLLLDTAALEITVHGWDVHRTISSGQGLPDALAADLLPVAALTVGEADRPSRFAAPRSVPRGAGPGRSLLAHLGREA